MTDYEKTLNYIHSLGMYSNPPQTDLSKIKYLCNLFGDPQNSCKTLHIAGTNGKGSTTAMIFNILEESGYKTGKFISPYIEKFNERISTEDGDISNEDIINYTNKLKNKIPKNFMPNEFEFLTLMAFLYYREKNCEYAAVETGLGGDLDPTNVIKSPEVSVITQIGLDHTQILGNTIEKIAQKKCGIIKNNSPVVLYPLNAPNIVDIVQKTANKKQSELIIPDISKLKILDENIDFTYFEYKNAEYKIKLLGRHQVYNALTVIESLNVLFKNNYKAVYKGIEKTYFPARFEILFKDPLFIFDGAHNISGISVLCDTVKNLLPDKKIILICGMLKDKNPREALEKICSESFVYKFIAVQVNSPRSETAENLCEYVLEYCENAEFADNLQNAVVQAFYEAKEKNLAVISFGSLYLAADIKKSIKSIIFGE